VLDLIGFDQRLDEQVPLELRFQDETGADVRLGDLFDQEPVILALGYFQCPNLCSLVRVGLVDALRQIRFDAGEQFQVVLVSIDPTETPALAAQVKGETLDTYARPDSAAGWHFLTGDHETIDALAAAVGFRYAYDPVQVQYAHASGLVLLTPQGKVARYLFGLEYAPRDLRLGLVEAAQNRIGSAVDQILLFCYHYNPATGRYTFAILTALRLVGTAFVLGMGIVIWRLWRQNPNEPATPV
jgi:protein SCO1/2